MTEKDLEIQNLRRALKLTEEMYDKQLEVNEQLHSINELLASENAALKTEIEKIGRMIMAICNNKKCSLGECDQPETCAAYVPVLTRADRIRAMNNEELAAILGEVCQGITDCVDCPFYSSGCPMSSSFKDWMDWLQQPSEVDRAQE